MAIQQKVIGICYNQGHQIVLVIKKMQRIINNNFEALQSLNIPITQINARHSNSAASKLTSDDMGGLEPTLFLAVGSRVMLTRNLWTEKRLCN